jgi:hypothetical protein
VLKTIEKEKYKTEENKKNKIIEKEKEENKRSVAARSSPLVPRLRPTCNSPAPHGSKKKR